MILPAKYLDKTCGVRPGPNQSSFNNIIYTAWYHISRKIKNNFSQTDFVGLMKHIDLNDDGKGLYKPKNSHDNITYKLILSKVFKLDLETNMSFWQAVKDVGFWRISDIILYGATFAPKLLRPVFRLFMFIPALKSLQAIYTGKKIRPQLFEPKPEDKAIQRFPWWYLPKKQIKEYPIAGGTVTVKEWKTYKGEIKATRHMQNDGMHLGAFRIYAFKDEYFEFRLVAKYAKKILKKRYGNDYIHVIIDKYFRDRNHPLLQESKGLGDIL